MNKNHVTSRYVTLLAFALSAAPTFSATIVLDEGFPNPNDPSPLTLVPGSAPAGWTQISRFGLSTVTLEPGGSLKIDMSPSAVTAIYKNDNTFDPTGAAVTMKTSVVSLTGIGTATNLASFGTTGPSAANIGWGLTPSGQFLVSAQVDGANDIPSCNGGGSRCLYNLGPALTQVDGSAYAGGAIEITAIFESSGFRITTNTGYDSATDPNAVGDYLPYTLLDGALDFGDLVSGSTVSLGMVGTSGTSEVDRVQLLTATGADSTTVASATTQSTTVATTTLSVASSGSVDQTDGTTTVLQTMTIEAGGTYTLTGGTLEATQIVVQPGGQFILAGGTLAADQVVGDITNPDGSISPGSSPGLTEITGDFTQSGLGSLLIEIAGTNPVSEYDVVQVGGTATLGGLLEVALLYGFVPNDGDSFDILEAANIIGVFDTLALPSIAGISWSLATLIDFDGTTDVLRLTASAVPIPAAAWLFGSALGLLGWARRRGS